MTTNIISSNHVKFIIALVAVLAIAGVALSFFSPQENTLALVPQQKTNLNVGSNAAESATESTAAGGTEVGTGWSTNNDPGIAVKEAAEMALFGKTNKAPDFAIIFATSGSDMNGILKSARTRFGNKTKIYGGTSDSRAVMTEKGYVKAEEKGYAEGASKHALAIMTIDSNEIVFGVGSAIFSSNISVQEASKAAVLDAIKSAGKLENDTPNIILLTPTIGVEEEVLEGIENVTGKDVPVLGGTAGGPTPGVFGKDTAYEKGVSLAVIYTNLPIGWVFEGGFDVTEPHSGIVTDVNGQELISIDNRPALDVYDEWLDGKITARNKAGADPSQVRDLLTLHPLYRKYTSLSGKDYYLFSHPWPKDDTLVERSVMTSTKIKQGERIYLSYGTWETLMNRVANLPNKAQTIGGMSGNKPVLGIGYVCAGVMGTIPEDEREKMAVLLDYANEGAPFIAPFTWGEEGQLPGIGNKHGNLLTSFLVIGPEK